MENANQYALLVIDMQLVAFDGEITPPVANGDRLLESVAKLIGLCRQTGIRVVFVQTCAISGQPYAKDVHGWELHPSLVPRNTDVIVFKHGSSGFDDTNLKAMLNELRVTNVITCGIWSEFCVANTSIDAAELGFGVIVAADGHGTVSSDADSAEQAVLEQNKRLEELKLRVLPIDMIGVL